MVETSLPLSVVAWRVSDGARQVPVARPVTLTTRTNSLDWVDSELESTTSADQPDSLHGAVSLPAAVWLTMTGRTSSASSGLWMLLAFTVTLHVTMVTPDDVTASAHTGSPSARHHIVISDVILSINGRLHQQLAALLHQLNWTDKIVSLLTSNYKQYYARHTEPWLVITSNIMLGTLNLD